MTILALDTASDAASVAVCRSGETLCEVALHSTDGFGHLLFAAIEEALSKSGVQLADVDCFAAANGPGSFTGVRVGLSAVKGLAAALNKPAAGISNLRALSSFGHTPMRATVIDARRGEIYGAVYDADLSLVMPEVVMAWTDWIERLPPGVEFVCRQGGPCVAAGVTFSEAPGSLATAIALCAEVDGPSGWQDPAVLDANYVRRSDAELFWKDR